MEADLLALIRKFAREHGVRLFDTRAVLAPLFANEPRGAVFSSAAPLMTTTLPRAATGSSPNACTRT